MVYSWHLENYLLVIRLRVLCYNRVFETKKLLLYKNLPYIFYYLFMEPKQTLHAIVTIKLP